MTALFALAAALVYGLGDYAGAMGSRLRGSSVAVLAYAYPFGAALMLCCAPFFGGSLSSRAWLYGVLGGLSGAIGVAILYGLMAIAPMNVISPVSAVLAAIAPVVFGVLVGERPHALAWFGMIAGVVAVLMVSRTGEDNPHGPISPRILAGAGLCGLAFGAYFIFLGHAGPSTGMWTLVIARLSGLVLVLGWSTSRGVLRPVFRGRLLLIAMAAGLCDATANLLFVLSTRHGLLAVASVLTSLYPAVTVILAMTLLHEHTSRLQRVGLALAAVSVAFVTV